MSKTVLYIEDHYHNRRLVEKVLTASGYEVLLAEDGERGWEMIQAHHPELILLDIALPGGLDGLDIAARIKADDELSDIWVIALTASAMHGDRERFLHHGCDDYLAKPIQVRELLAKVEGFFTAREEEERHMPTILIMEDDPDQSRLMRRLLEHGGYEVMVANDGESGLKQAMISPPDLILLDMGLPDLDGQTVAGLIRGSSMLADIPVVAVTAWPREVAAEMVKLYGCDGYLSKPISARTFARRIGEFLKTADVEGESS
ncbi:MAG: response regulator [Anaerolineae bacterium]